MERAIEITTTFTKVNLKKSDDQTNIDKYRVTANIISKL